MNYVMNSDCSLRIYEMHVAITATDRRVAAAEGEKALGPPRLENEFSSFSRGQMV